MSVDTVSERIAMNKAVAKERLHDMGIKGFILHMHRKLLTNYNDGTFCWGGEGSFCAELLPEPTFATLFFAGSAACFENGKSILELCMLTLIGLTIFEQLFEARARYFFIYIPFFILLVPSGMLFWKKQCTKIIRKLKRDSEKC